MVLKILIRIRHSCWSRAYLSVINAVIRAVCMSRSSATNWNALQKLYLVRFPVLHPAVQSLLHYTQNSRHSNLIATSLFHLMKLHQHKHVKISNIWIRMHSKQDNLECSQNRLFQPHKIRFGFKLFVNARYSNGDTSYDALHLYNRYLNNVNLYALQKDFHFHHSRWHTERQNQNNWMRKVGNLPQMGKQSKTCKHVPGDFKENCIERNLLVDW